MYQLNTSVFIYMWKIMAGFYFILILKENKGKLVRNAKAFANYNDKGECVIPKDDEWRTEDKWDIYDKNE